MLQFLKWFLIRKKIVEIPIIISFIEDEKLICWMPRCRESEPNSKNNLTLAKDIKKNCKGPEIILLTIV